MVQVSITVGLVVGYFMCYGTIRIPSSMSWRFPFAIQSGLAFVLAIAAEFWLPHSPRWLAYKGRTQEALVVWDKLGVSDTEREKDLRQVSTSDVLVESVELAPQTSQLIGIKSRWVRSLNNLSRIFGKDSRKQMFLGVFVMSMQQLSGIDGVLYVSMNCSSKHFTLISALFIQIARHLLT